MSGEIRCPKCGSKDVTCSENPHNHVCHACGYSMLPTDDVSALDDELVEAVAQAIHDARVQTGGTACPRDTYYARAVLSVPALRDALARDAQVREIVGETLAADPDDVVPMSYVYADGMDDVIALYPEVASMLRDGKGFDDSDIMPGSEFDGPVVL